MTKRFCDRCGKEIGVFKDIVKDINFQTWWTIERHGMFDSTTELCDACYQSNFKMDLVKDSDDLVKELVKASEQ